MLPSGWVVLRAGWWGRRFDGGDCEIQWSVSLVSGFGRLRGEALVFEMGEEAAAAVVVVETTVVAGESLLRFLLRNDRGIVKLSSISVLKLLSSADSIEELSSPSSPSSPFSSRLTLTLLP